MRSANRTGDAPSLAPAAQNRRRNADVWLYRLRRFDMSGLPLPAIRRLAELWILTNVMRRMLGKLSPETMGEKSPLLRPSDDRRQPLGSARSGLHGAASRAARHCKTRRAGRSTTTGVRQLPAAKRRAAASCRRRGNSRVSRLAVREGSPVLDNLVGNSLLSALGGVSGEAVDHMEDVGGDALGHL